jgi:hypothetical protein
MSCCGSKRQGFYATPRFYATPITRHPNPDRVMTDKRSYRIICEYLGDTRLNLTSENTGKRYLFEKRGSRCEIDPRDRLSLISHPLLRQVT